MKRISLTAWIFIGMAAGVALGILAPEFAAQLGLVSTIFLRLIRSIIAPLHLRARWSPESPAAAISNTWAASAAKRFSISKSSPRSRSSSDSASSISCAPAKACRSRAPPPIRSPPLRRRRSAAIVEHTFPASIIDAMARNDVLQVVVFAFLFGAACAAIGGKAEPVVTFCSSLAEVMFRYTKYVMYLAPLGVGAALAVTVGRKGVGVLFGLGKLILTMYGALVLFVVIVLGAVVTHRAHSAAVVLPGRARAFHDRLLHGEQRGRPAPGAREHGKVRRAETHRRLRDSHRLQLQSGWHHALPFDGVDVRGAGRRAST